MAYITFATGDDFYLLLNH